MRPKIFAAIPAKNDAWILPTVLGSVSLWADHIIVVDESSWDNTEAVCRNFPKTRLLRIQPGEFNESNRRQVLLKAVREYGGQNLIFGLDSDEIITGEIMQPGVLDAFISQMKPGMSARLQWIMLWKNVRQYRYDPTPEWSGSYKNFVYWDDGEVSFENVRMHSSRSPESTLARAIDFSGFKVLHYAFADWPRMMAKHVYYLALEKTMGSKVHPYILNRKYRWFYTAPSSGPVILEVPKAWTLPFSEAGVVMEDFKPQDLYWYESEVLRFFSKFGPAAFKHFNIWNTEWDAKKKIAQTAGEVGLPEGKIGNPQPWYDKFYYSHLQNLLDQGGVIDRIKNFVAR